jgi:hypothetical protein
MNKPLSPATQAVMDAFENASDGEYVEGVWVVNERTMLAAALRAAADQAVPDDITWASPKEQTRHYPSAQQKAGEQGMASVVRRRLLLIAAELEALDD